MHSVQNSNTFLGFYNQIDKFFATIIGAKSYIPFTEKVAIVAEWNYSQTKFVQQFQNKLRYFWDLRNQLVHGFSLDKKHYVVASDYAVEQIKRVYEELTKPKSVGEMFTHKVYTCNTNDSLKEVISIMRNDLNTHIPVYNEQWKFVEMLSESTIAYRVAEQISDDWILYSDEVTVWDIPLENSNDTFVFVDKDTSVYKIEELFSMNHEQKKRLGAVFVTSSGDSSMPITWIVTAMDLPKLASMRIL